MCGFGYNIIAKMENEKVNIETIKEYINQMYSLKPVYSNYYNQPFTTNDFFYKTDDTLIILKTNEGYNRVFVMSNNLQEAAKMLESLTGTNVINIPSKGDISIWKNLFELAHYEQISVYERYYYTKIKLAKNNVATFALPSQCEDIYNLFYTSGFFSPFTDYLPTCSELYEWICQKKVIVHEVDGKIVGAFMFSIEGKQCYFRAWIDQSNNGLKLLFDVYNIMYNKGLNYAYFWVNAENKNVKSIHQLFGAKPDGLKDYTFIKQI
jgi:hypothetical protein